MSSYAQLIMKHTQLELRLVAYQKALFNAKKALASIDEAECSRAVWDAVVLADEFIDDVLEQSDD
jgi:hypothetical protein